VPVQTPGELLRYQLSIARAMEAQSLLLLPVLNRYTDHPQIRQLLSIHLAETEQQLKRLEDCFQRLGLEPHSLSLQTLEGVQADLQLFLQQEPSQEALDLYCLDLLSQVRRLETSVYRSIDRMAQLMGELSCLATIGDMLGEEETALTQVEQLAARLAVAMIQRVPPQ
jgi:Mn-containing catalase